MQVIVVAVEPSYWIEISILLAPSEGVPQPVPALEDHQLIGPTSSTSFYRPLFLGKVLDLAW